MNPSEGNYMPQYLGPQSQVGNFQGFSPMQAQQQAAQYAAMQQGLMGLGAQFNQQNIAQQTQASDSMNAMMQPQIRRY